MIFFTPHVLCVCRTDVSTHSILEFAMILCTGPGSCTPIQTLRTTRSCFRKSVGNTFVPVEARDNTWVSSPWAKFMAFVDRTNERHQDQPPLPQYLIFVFISQFPPKLRHQRSNDNQLRQQFEAHVYLKGRSGAEKIYDLYGVEPNRCIP